MVVTGGASGIGAATVKLFATKGATVIVADLKEKHSKEDSSNAIDASKLSFIKMDVSKFESVKKGLEQIIADHGKIDVMVCNAGIGTRSW